MLLITLLLSKPLSITVFNIISDPICNKASGASGRVEGWLSKVREFNTVVLQFWPGKLQCLEKQHTLPADISNNYYHLENKNYQLGSTFVAKSNLKVCVAYRE